VRCESTHFPLVSRKRNNANQSTELQPQKNPIATMMLNFFDVDIVLYQQHWGEDNWKTY